MSTLIPALTDFRTKEGATESKRYLVPETPPLFTGLPKLKVVNFFGLPVAVPKGFKWIAADDNGNVFVYRKKPFLDNGEWQIKDKHILPAGEIECLQVSDLLYFLDDVTNDQAEKSLIRVKDLPRYYP